MMNTNTNNYKGNRQYHYQADVDIFAKSDDNYTGYLTARIKDIKDAYNEFMQDLLLESQEAY